LLGRNWLDKFFPDWRAFYLSPSTVNQTVGPGSDHFKLPILQFTARFPNVLCRNDALAVTGFSVNLTLKEGAIPVFR